MKDSIPVSQDGQVSIEIDGKNLMRFITNKFAISLSMKT